MVLHGLAEALDRDNTKLRRVLLAVYEHCVVARPTLDGQFELVELGLRKARLQSLQESRYCLQPFRSSPLRESLSVPNCLRHIAFQSFQLDAAGRPGLHPAVWELLCALSRTLYVYTINIL